MKFSLKLFTLCIGFLILIQGNICYKIKMVNAGTSSSMSEYFLGKFSSIFQQNMESLCEIPNSSTSLNLLKHKFAKDLENAKTAFDAIDRENKDSTELFEKLLNVRDLEATNTSFSSEVNFNKSQQDLEKLDNTLIALKSRINQAVKTINDSKLFERIFKNVQNGDSSSSITLSNIDEASTAVINQIEHINEEKIHNIETTDTSDTSDTNESSTNSSNDLSELSNIFPAFLELKIKGSEDSTPPGLYESDVLCNNPAACLAKKLAWNK